MATETQTYLERFRKRASEQAKKALERGSTNAKEWTPKEAGKTRIRLLPPINDEAEFYYSHSYHYLKGIGKNSNGEYVYSKKKYNVNGKNLTCPIDAIAKDMKDSGEPALKKQSAEIRRQHWYYTNAIVYEDGKPPEFKILKDNTNKGKLFRLICATIGVPFFRDIEDNWLEKGSDEIDPDREYKDLLDVKNGYDFYIVKTVTGKENWEFNYEKSYASNKPRALTEEEVKLLDERVDLVNYIQYVDNYDAVEASLEKYLNAGSDEPESEKQNTVASEPVKSSAKPAVKPVTTAVDEPINIDELAAQLDD